MSPARHRQERRWPVLAIVLLVVAGIGVVAATRSTPAQPASAPRGPAALVAAPDAESSAWYCTGQTTASGAAAGFVLLTNTTGRAVTATVDAVSDSGATERAVVSVAAHATVVPALASLTSGGWEAQTVTLSGGGVAVSQDVHGSTGWSEAPCQSTTSGQWYFPGGSTSGSNGLTLSLLNPTSMPVVVDVSFVTPSGAVHPVNYQGIVLQPGQVQAIDVASEIQNTSTVSTEVATRTGRVVASELQVYSGGSPGLALVPGAATPQVHWAIPQAGESSGGSSEIDVFNPGPTPQSVTVDIRLPSGPLAPLNAEVDPDATWVLQTSKQTRIPQGENYSAEIDSSGPGVVVGRTVMLPSSAPSPQSGMGLAVDALSMASPSGEWVVPPPGSGTTFPVSGAGPASLALTNTGAGTESYTAWARSSSGDRVLATGALASHETLVVSGSPLSAAGQDPIMVRSDGPMAISAVVGPAGGTGVVTMPGVPLAAAIGI